MILVVGATGRLGGAIARLLLGQGKRVRILVRQDSPSTELAAQGLATAAESLLAAGAEIVMGDLRDRASVARAVQGIDTIVATATAIQRDGDLEGVDKAGMLALVQEAQAAGVRHFIYVSVLGAAPGHPSPLMDAKGTVEQALQKGGMAWTILRPAKFFEVWVANLVGMPIALQLPVTLVEGDTPHAFVSEGDVAAYVVKSVENPRAENRSFEVAGPESYTWSQCVQAMGDAFGMDLPLRFVAPGETVAGLPAHVVPMLAAEAGRPEVVDMSETALLFGVTPTPLETFAGRFAEQVKMMRAAQQPPPPPPPDAVPG